MNAIVISVARDFSKTPGPRRINEGPFSGELFLDRHLKPKFLKAESASVGLVVELDGTAGYATSFLESAFGGLSREFGAERVLARLEISSSQEPALVHEIIGYIKEASQ